MLLRSALSFLSLNRSEFLQPAQTWAGLPWYLWLLIFLLVVILLWWRLSRSAKQFDQESGRIQPLVEADRGHTDEEPAEPVEEEEEEGEVAKVIEVSAAPDAVSDDLTKIEGIGPKISSLLAEYGINGFEQLARSTPDQLNQIVKDAGLHMANTTTWPEQAKLAEEGKWDELAKLQDELKGGRKV